MLPALLLAVALAQSAEAETLELHSTVAAEIAADAGVVHTLALDTGYTTAPTVGRSYRLRVDEAGPYHVDLRSHFFDSYLILRAFDGSVLAEDDDGGLGLHARIVVELEAGLDYSVTACALHGDRGPLELSLGRGRPTPRSGAELAPAVLADARERVAAVRSRYGEEHPSTGIAVNNLANVLTDAGRYGEAETLYEQVLETRERTLGAEHPLTAQALNNLAVLFKKTDRLEQARPLQARAVAINEAALGADHPDTLTNLLNLANLLERLGDYSTARPILERVLAGRERLLGPLHVDTAQALNDLGFLLHRQGEYASARASYERAIDAYSKTVGPEHRRTSGALDNLGRLLYDQGDFAAARPVFERALNICEKESGPDHLETAISANNLAIVLDKLGDEPGARRLYERALVIWERTLGPRHVKVATSLNNLGFLAEGRGDFEGALEYFERALQIRIEALGPRHPETALGLNNLAYLHSTAGRVDEARRLYERALSIREEVLGLEHPSTASTLTNLAVLVADTGDAQAAWEIMRREHRHRRAHTFRILTSLAEAERHLYVARTLNRLELQLSLAEQIDVPAVHVAAYEDVLSWKGQLSRLLAATRERLVTQTTPGQRELMDALQAAQARLSSLALATDVADAEAHAARLAESRATRQRLELELYRSTSDSRVAVEGVPFDELRGSLPARSALVDLFVHRWRRPLQTQGEPRSETWSEPRVSAWITRAESEAPLHVDLGPAADLEDTVRSFLESLVSHRGEPLEDTSRAGDELRAQLFDPLAPHLKGVETVFVSPDSFLGTLSLESLPLQDGSLLLEHFAFVYLQDVSYLARRTAATADAGGALIVGGVSFRKGDELRPEATLSPTGGDLRGSFASYWGSLPATGYESQVLFDLHTDALGDGAPRLLLQGTAPTEERLKRELPRYANLHLATHGFFNPEGIPSLWEAARAEAAADLQAESRRIVGRHPGLLSGLVCAGANAPTPDGPEDGYLTAEEVGWLDLSGVRLVVLSACETGLGQPRSGEGLLGLRRAFHTAGARTVISSLWSVRDDSTARLMQDFYRNLWVRGQSPLEALRAAQLGMLQRNRAQFGEPRTASWAAFVLSGEWE